MCKCFVWQNQVKKEARTIPKLIYGMEQLETVLIKISKKSKVCGGRW